MNEILEALEKLHEFYPDQRVDIWASYYEQGGGVVYIAHVTSFDMARPGRFSDNDHSTPMAAAEDLIGRVGPREKAAELDEKIAELRKQLAELESQTK